MQRPLGTSSAIPFRIRTGSRLGYFFFFFSRGWTWSSCLFAVSYVIPLFSTALLHLFGRAFCCIAWQLSSSPFCRLNPLGVHLSSTTTTTEECEDGGTLRKSFRCYPFLSICCRLPPCCILLYPSRCMSCLQQRRSPFIWRLSRLSARRGNKRKAEHLRTRRISLVYLE